MKENDIIDLAKAFAYKAHTENGQKYDGFPYTLHLDLTVEAGYKYIHLIPRFDRPYVIAGCYVHDVLEDTDYSYNNLMKACGLTVAEYSFALQNEKGRNRDEKANAAYYYGIRIYKHSTFIKLCDRIANGNYSKKSGSSMIKRYKKEYPHFKDELFDGRFLEMWEELDSIFN